MKTKSRIESIQNANCLDSSLTGFPTFDLADLTLPADLEFELPSNLRLGHLAEKVVSGLIKSSCNYKVLFENVQILDGKKTIGEIDFIVENLESQQRIHLELAYKFYLFDPSISSDPLNNWIGPNRNDSLQEKLQKLRSKQFPLRNHPCAISTLQALNVDELSQALCFLVSFFTPYADKGRFSPSIEKAIKGYYLNFEAFSKLDNASKSYHLPHKKEWGIHPSENEIWSNFKGVEGQINQSLKEKQSLLCWQKQNDAYETFFIVWW